MLVAATLPDVTAIPFVTTLKPYLLNPATNLPVQLNGQNIPLLGPDGPLTSSHYVTLAAAPLLAQGVGIPTILGGQGTPLPDEVVLDPTEVAFIRQRVAEDNQAIQEICLAAGVPVLDLHGVLDQLANEGIEIGGIRLTNAFLTGGVFSYDGVHLTDLGYAVVANYWIRLIDSKGGAVPEVSLTPYFGLAGAASGRVTATMSGHAPAAEFSAEAYQELLAAFPPLDR